MIKNVLLTGASSGIGEAIKKQLLTNSLHVITLGRSDTNDIICDLQDIKQLEKNIKSLNKNTPLHVVINCAGFGVFEPLECTPLHVVDEMININLKLPIMLSSLCLRNLAKNGGHIINITSIEALRSAKFSALYSATKSGLRAFSLCLFEECRKSGVRVTSINPDMTKTPFFDELHFEPSHYIEANEIAQNVLHVINSPSVITDLTIRAQKLGIKKK